MLVDPRELVLEVFLLLPAAFASVVWLTVAVARRKEGAVRAALVGITRGSVVVLALCLLWELAQV